MQIDRITCPGYIEDKIETKHNITVWEACQTLLAKPRIRFAEKGHTKGQDVYVAFGQTWGGRYLAVFFVYKPKGKTAIIISARDMSKRERKSYGRKSN